MAPRTSWAVWIISVIATVVILGYQRRTGPTYPMPVSAVLGSASASGQLVRTRAGAGPAVVAVTASDGVVGTLVWRRYPTSDPWNQVSMARRNHELVAELPHQPVAGKLEYTVRLSVGSQSAVLPTDGSTIIRFRDEVPVWVLVPHILCMFAGLLFGLRCALGALVRDSGATKWLPATTILMALGGFVLGPLMQKYAFGAYWTGWPLGEDLTDTKTLVAVAVWFAAWWICARWPAQSRPAVLLATVVMLAVYLVPHSVRGSQVDWSKVPTQPAVALRG